jgi:parallel beta-helix repeat protein
MQGMSKKTVLLLVFASLLLTMPRVRVIVLVMAETAVIMVPADYPTIQAAINSANSGDTILVAPDIYYENVVVNKTVSLLGEDRDATIIDGGGTSAAVSITSNGVTISNFTMQHSTTGIYIYQSSNSTVTQNNIHSSSSGITLSRSNGNILTDNEISNNTWAGIGLAWSNSNTITDNDIHSNNIYGITLQFSSNYNTISGNNIYLNAYGISQISSNYNTIVGNNIYSNGGMLWLPNTWLRIGIDLVGSSYNRVFHNNFINNTAYVGTQINYWDDGYPSGGNYWSDYNGTDFYGGPSQNETGSDGIGDTPFNLNLVNKDRYPLMGPIHLVNAGVWNETTYPAEIVSNSTISNFYFSESEKLISFNVTGPNSTTGFCRISIPNELLWCDSPEQWQVWVNNTLIEDRKIIQDTNQTYIYFTYNHSTQNVRITGIHATPEFSAWISMLLAFFMLSAAAVVFKRKIFKTTNHFS